MKVMLVNGSSHLHGTTMTALEEMIKVFYSEEVETEVVQLDQGSRESVIGRGSGKAPSAFFFVSVCSTCSICYNTNMDSKRNCPSLFLSFLGTHRVRN